MEDYKNTRILLDIDLIDRHYRYSDVDGPAHKYSTSSNGNVIVEDDIILYKGLIMNSGDIKNSFNVTTNKPSVGNVSVSIFNEDNLHLGNHPVAIESGNASIKIINNDDYEDIINSFSGKIDSVQWDREIIKFQIRSEEITIYRNVPDIVFDEKTFQDTRVIVDPKFVVSEGIIMRFGETATPIWGYEDDDRIEVRYAKRITHPELKAPDDYWKGARIDCVDASGTIADPESSNFAIGEFAVAIRSADDYIVLPTVLDRYYMYTFIDKNLREHGNDATGGNAPSAPYEMHSVLNNTMSNAWKADTVLIKNGGFDVDAEWTKGVGWSIGSGVATCTPTVGSTDLAYNDTTMFEEGAIYIVEFDLLSFTQGRISVHINGVPVGADFSTTIRYLAPGISGRYKMRIKAGAQTGGATDGLRFYTGPWGGFEFGGSIDNVTVNKTDTAKFLITRKPVPENADSVGKPFPIVYGHVEKMYAVWAISAKSTRQNSLSAGDDLYVIAGHKIYDRSPTEVRVYFGLDENAQGMNYKHGSLDYVPNPLPRSISEIDPWHEGNLTGDTQPTVTSKYDLRSGDPSKDVCPFHKLVEVTTNYGDVVTAIKLRGDEYTGWFDGNELPPVEVGDGDLPGINGQPQFPIRYGLGNSKIYVSFRGMEDTTGVITGIPNSLIEHPVDIIKHFLLHYTNINNDRSKINDQTFADAKARLENWRFGAAITDIADGKKILERLTGQCKANWQWKNGVFNISVLDLENRDPVFFINEREHFVGKQSWSRPKLSGMYNDFIMKYGFNSIKNEYDRVVVRNKSNDQLCRNMYSEYGVIRSLKEILCPDIFDSFTANKLMDHYVLLYAIQRHTFTTNLRYSEDTREIQPGSVVSITFVDVDDVETTETYLATSISMKRDSFKASFLELP